MTRRLISRPIATMAVLALGSVLAACSPEFENYEVTPTTPKQPIAEWTTSDLAVKFEPGTAKLVAGESGRIAQALAKEDPTRPLRVIARTNAENTPAKLAIERAAALREVVASHGVEVEYQGPKVAGRSAVLPDPSARDTALLFVAHYEVTVPGCPDWRKPYMADFSNTESSNFGCANAVNLGLMVADPGDLARGKAFADADGTRSAKAINDYRIGKSPIVGKPDLPPAKAAQTLTTSN